MKCDLCGRELNPVVDTVYQAVSGWAKLRDAGGANAIANRIGHNRFRCKGCISIKDDNQMELFEL